MYLSIQAIKMENETSPTYKISKTLKHIRMNLNKYMQKTPHWKPQMLLKNAKINEECYFVHELEDA